METVNMGNLKVWRAKYGIQSGKILDIKFEAEGFLRWLARCLATALEPVDHLASLGRKCDRIRNVSRGCFSRCRRVCFGSTAAD